MKRILLKNIASLAAVQGGNYIIPLITLPYLVKSLGPYSYGVLGFSLAVIQYFNIIINYGFNLSATQKIALNSNDRNEVSKVFWNVISCQLLLLLLCSVILLLTLAASDLLRQQFVIILSGMGVLIGNILFPVWLYQGKESMSLSSFINITSRLLSIPLIFNFVKTSEDAWVAALIMSATSFMGGLISVIIIIKGRWITWHKIKVKEIQHQFSDGWYLFLSTAAVNIYTSSITLLLGFICGPLVVGYFVAADKLRLAAQGLLIPISQACYPRVVTMLANNKKEGLEFIRRLLFIQGGLGLLIGIGIFFFSSYIIEFLYGNDYNESKQVLMILSVCPFLIALSNIFGVHVMSVLGYKKKFFTILTFASFICLVILYPLSKVYSENGAALTVVASEVLVTILMFRFIKKEKILNGVR